MSNTLVAQQAIMSQHGMQGRNMIESIKPLLLTMMMVKQTDNANPLQMMWSMLAIAFVEYLLTNMSSFINALIRTFSTKVSKTFETKMPNLNSLGVTDCKKSSISVKFVMGEKFANTYELAILDCVTNFCDTRSILYTNNIYCINYTDPIEISPDMFIKSCQELNVDAAEGIAMHLEIYSNNMNMTELRGKITDIVNDYNYKIKNKLGSNVYYFNHMCYDSKVESAKLPPVLNFSFQQFYTTRKFNNLFGSEINLIKQRTMFFRDNKKWYDDKGIPHTLGILMSGDPGTGKTSTIKCLANELNRHIINITLSKNITKNQLENLFHNELLTVTANGRTEQFLIPINKRIFVIEDCDCDNAFLLDRNGTNLSREDQLMDELLKVREDYRQLQDSMTNRTGTGPIIIKQQSSVDPINSQDNSKITLSFLLNLLDGVLETPGRVIIMTSNHVNKLDPALIRPGRFDIMCNFGKCSHTTIIDMIEFHYDCALNDEQLKQIKSYDRLFITPARMSQILFENFGDIDAALHKLNLYYVNYCNSCNSHTAQSFVEPIKQVNCAEPTKRVLPSTSIKHPLLSPDDNEQKPKNTRFTNSFDQLSYVPTNKNKQAAANDINNQINVLQQPTSCLDSPPTVQFTCYKPGNLGKIATPSGKLSQQNDFTNVNNKAGDELAKFNLLGDIIHKRIMNDSTNAENNDIIPFTPGNLIDTNAI